MSGFNSILKDLDRKFGLDHCVICCNPTHTRDALGFPWCVDHEQRGQILSWGYRHKFPALPVEGLPLVQWEDGITTCHYAVGATERSWWIVATNGNDDFVWTVVIYIEYLDSLKHEKQAS